MTTGPAACVLMLRCALPNQDAATVYQPARRQRLNTPEWRALEQAMEAHTASEADTHRWIAWDTLARSGGLAWLLAVDAHRVPVVMGPLVAGVQAALSEAMDWPAASAWREATELTPELHLWHGQVHHATATQADGNPFATSVDLQQTCQRIDQWFATQGVLAQPVSLPQSFFSRDPAQLPPILATALASTEASVWQPMRAQWLARRIADALGDEPSTAARPRVRL